MKVEKVNNEQTAADSLLQFVYYYTPHCIKKDRPRPVSFNKKYFGRLPGYVYRPQLADNSNLYLSGILHFFLDLVSDFK